jgi:hypothetical protein
VLELLELLEDELLEWPELELEVLEAAVLDDELDELELLELEESSSCPVFRWNVFRRVTVAMAASA